MGLFLLPVEVLHYISSYLSVKDVLTLSQTCRYLRNSLNSDHVWKRYLPQQDISSLESHQQMVQQCTFSQEPVSTISTLCKNRMDFMRKTQLVNNWRNGHCTVTSIHSILCTRNPIWKNKIHYFDNRYFLLLADFEDHECIEFWDIEAEPLLYMSLKVKLFKDAQIVGKKLVVFVACEIQVYKIMINERVLSLMHSFVVTEHSIVLKGLPNNCKHSSCPEWYHYIHDQLLMSIKNGRLHVCNIEEGSIIGIFTLPPKISSLKNIDDILVFLRVTSAYGNNILFKITHRTNFFCPVYFTFNTLKKEILEIEFNESVMESKIYKKQIIMFNCTHIDNNILMSISCKLYDLETFTELCKREFVGIHNQFEFLYEPVVNGKFALLFSTSVKIIDVLTLNTVYEIHYPNLSCFCLAKQYDILDSTFILVRNLDKVEMWDMQNDKMLPLLPYFNPIRNDVFINSICTKVVCYDYEMDSISVLNFW